MYRKWYVLEKVGATFEVVRECHLASSAKAIADELNKELEPEPKMTLNPNGLDWDIDYFDIKKFFVSHIHPDNATREDYEHFKEY